MKKATRSLLAAASLLTALPGAFAQLEAGGDMLENCSRIVERQKVGK